jgi:hypothetical protein
MENNDYPETFDLSLFIADAPFEEIMDQFTNGRTIDKANQNKNKIFSVEEFMNETKPTKPEKMNKEELKKHLENLEKQIEEEHTN